MIKTSVIILAIFMSQQIFGFVNKAHILRQLESVSKNIAGLRTEIEPFSFDDRQILAATLDRKLEEIDKQLSSLRQIMAGPQVQRFERDFVQDLSAAIQQVRELRGISNRLPQISKKSEWQVSQAEINQNFNKLSEILMLTHRSFRAEFERENSSSDDK